MGCVRVLIIIYDAFVLDCPQSITACPSYAHMQLYSQKRFVTTFTPYVIVSSCRKSINLMATVHFMLCCVVVLCLALLEL
jgi:hypothetical protein